MLDFIAFEHNQHEIKPWKEHCDKLGIIFNVRIGNAMTKEGLNEIRPKPDTEEIICDWPWKILTINWDGAIFPCCEYAMWSGAKAIENYQLKQTNIKEVWNGSSLRNLRRIHVNKGRKSIPTCAVCHNQGLKPQA
jgi:radical SAM protein with 4Fe4S-binding SPASM domain